MVPPSAASFVRGQPKFIAQSTQYQQGGRCKCDFPLLQRYRTLTYCFPLREYWNALFTVALPLQLEIRHLLFGQHHHVIDAEATQAKWSTIRDHLLQKHDVLRQVEIIIRGDQSDWELK